MSRLRSALIAGLIATLVACGQVPPPDGTPGAPLARLELSAPVTLLTHEADRLSVAVAAYDTTGARVQAPVTWTSSAPDVARVDPDGTVVAGRLVGEASITAESGGVRSAPVTVTTARLQPDAALVTPAMVVTAPARDGGDGALGTQFHVTLTGTPPTPGQVLLSTGDSPFAGRVLSVAQVTGGTLVTLETVALTDAYRNLEVHQQLSLDAASVVPTPGSGAAAPVRVERHGDGSVTLTYRVGDAGLRTQPLAAPVDDVLPGPFLKKEFTIGPFACSSTLDTLISGDLISIKLEAKVDADIVTKVVDGQLTAFGAQLSGELVGTLSGGLDVDLGVQGELKCRATIVRLPIPLTGPISAFLSPTVPVGVGLLLDGKLKLGKVQFGLEGKLGGKINAGFTLDGPSGELKPTFKLTPVNTLVPNVKVLVGPDAVRLEGGLGTHVTAGLDFTTMPWLGASAPSFSALDLTVGPRIEGSVAPVATQASASDYASSFTFKLLGTLGPGDQLQEVLAVAGTRNQVKLGNFSGSLDVTLGRSPNGTLTGNASAQVGEAASATVDLNPANLSLLPGVYNVQEVQLYRERDGQLELIGSQSAQDAQTRFEFTWTPDLSDTGKDVVLRAFVTTRAGGSFPLEIDDDARLGVKVDPAPTQTHQGAWTGTITRTWTRERKSVDEANNRVWTIEDHGSLTCTFEGQPISDWAYTGTLTYALTTWAHSREQHGWYGTDTVGNATIDIKVSTIGYGDGLPTSRGTLERTQSKHTVIKRYQGDKLVAEESFDDYAANVHYNLDCSVPEDLDTDPDPDHIAYSGTIQTDYVEVGAESTETLSVNLTRK